MVHKGAKWTMGIGGAVLLISLIFIVFGVLGIMESASETDEHWTGTAPVTTELKLSEMSTYPVFVEDTDTTVTISPSSDDNRFIPCSSDDASYYCGDKSDSGLTYIGDLSVIISGNYSVEFDGNGAIEIREMEFETEDILATGLGTCACCLGAITLLVGIILAFTLKEKAAHSNVVMVDPSTGQLISHQQPYAPSGAVVVQQPVVADPAMEHYNELLSQGYESSKAESYARMRYPEFKRP